MLATNRVLTDTGRTLARTIAAGPAARAAAPPAPADRGEQWRGAHGLMLADRILRQASAGGVITREDVTPDMEPENPSLDNAEVFDEEHNDHVPEENMEPFDPTIESSIAAPRRKATVEEHDDGSVTIHPAADEVLDVSEMAGGDVMVHVEEETPPEEMALAGSVAKSVTIVIDLDIDEHDNQGDESVDTSDTYSDTGDDMSDDHSTESH